MSDTLKLSAPDTRQFWEIHVLYEDAQLLALDKPADLPASLDPIHPDGPSLMALLHRDLARPAPWAQGRHLAYLAAAHRLDSEASGVLLLAKDKPTLLALLNQFGARQPRRTFVALVRGQPPADTFRADTRLAPDRHHPGRFRVEPRHGKQAVSEFAVRERFAGYALLEGRPLTDRKHQIRVHLRRCGLPLAGDRLYGGAPLLLSRLKRGYRFKPDQEERPLVGRTALHAEQLTLRHPVGGGEITITAPWPKDLTVAVKYLRRFAPAAAGPTPFVSGPIG